jgi:hypothetical protein
MFLSIDLSSAHDACIWAIETGAPQTFERDDDPAEWDFRTMYLAQVCAARPTMNHSTGPFEEAFDELAEVLARRVVGRCGCEGAAHA